MNSYNVPLLDLRNTLPNLKNLVVTLSASAACASALNV